MALVPDQGRSVVGAASPSTTHLPDCVWFSFVAVLRGRSDVRDAIREFREIAATDPERAQAFLKEAIAASADARLVAEDRAFRARWNRSSVVLSEAKSFASSNPERADKLFAQAVEMMPTGFNLGIYAMYLRMREDLDRSEEMYARGSQ
jgi:hypothetical protein